MMKKSIIVATVIGLYYVEKFQKNSLRAPLLLGSLEYKYIHMYMCGQTHLGNGGKMVRLVFDQKKIELA